MTSKQHQPKLNRSITMDLTKIKRRERLKHSSTRNYDKLIRNRINRNDTEIIDLNYDDINLNLMIRNREQQQQQQQLLLNSKSNDRYISVEEEEEKEDKNGLIKHDYESINEDTSPPKIQPRRIYMNYSNKVIFKIIKNFIWFLLLLLRGLN